MAVTKAPFGELRRRELWKKEEEGRKVKEKKG
jgi:hypothetical protein